MIRDGGKGGRTVTGLVFEKGVGLEKIIGRIPDYRVIPGEKSGRTVQYREQPVARILGKHEFYAFLEEHGIDAKRHVSRRLLPDDALFNLRTRVLHIIEAKYQETSGSVDEKLQTCDFKRKQYLKLTQSLLIRLEYVYVLNDWFRRPEYRDVLEYIATMQCHYVFNSLPLESLGLPLPPEPRLPGIGNP